MSDNHSTKDAGSAAERRSFLTRFVAIVCGGIVALFPFAAGWGVIIDPWRRSRRESGKDLPHAFPVISDTVDAWTRTANQRIGMIFLERTDKNGKPEVVAFNAECPHLGCFVDYNPADEHFECPCHKSAFNKEGEKVYGPSRRNLDPLPVRLEASGDQTEVRVAFQNFQTGIAERKPAG
jgi:nitrite reductase/ring-hydroxylating ferredoxin subunit